MRHSSHETWAPNGRMLRRHRGSLGQTPRAIQRAPTGRVVAPRAPAYRSAFYVQKNKKKVSKTKPKPVAGTKAKAGHRKQPLSALVVDDVLDNRDLYGEYLRASGFRVDEAEDGQEALDKVALDRPDVVIMDLSMPRLDGWEATRRLKADPKTKGIVIVVVTGHATPEDLERAKATGADGVVVKPCLPLDLLTLVQKLLARR